MKILRLNTIDMKQLTNKDRRWYLVDLAGKSYGRQLSHVANLLIGKGKTEYVSNLDQGDYVVLVNAAKAHFTGRKLEQKKYYKHTGYIGNLKERTLEEMLEKNPVELIKLSVAGMLPKNKLRDTRLARLKVYKDEIHPHQNVKFEE